MRWCDLDSPEAMIEAATRIHDRVWPTSSPTPAPKLMGCLAPERECIHLAIAQQTHYGWCCTNMSFLPRIYSQECPSRIHDWRPGQTAQGGGYESKPPGGGRVLYDKTAAIVAWLRHVLDWLTVNCGDPAVRIYAQTLLDDADVPVSERVMLKTGALMLERKNHERPWLDSK